MAKKHAKPVGASGSTVRQLHPLEKNAQQKVRRPRQDIEHTLSPVLTTQVGEHAFRKAQNAVLADYAARKEAGATPGGYRFNNSEPVVYETLADEALELLRMLGLAEPATVWVKGQTGEHSRERMTLAEYRLWQQRKAAARYRQKQRKEQFKGLILTDTEEKELEEQEEKDRRILHESVNEAIRALRAGETYE